MLDVSGLTFGTLSVLTALCLLDASGLTFGTDRLLYEVLQQSDLT